MKIEAYKSFFEQGMAKYNSGDLSDAKRLLLRAAEIAEDISVSALTMSAKREYHEAAVKLVEFVKTKCGEKKRAVVSGNSGNEEKSGASPSDADRKEIASETEKPKVTFSDVAGLSDVKEQVALKILEPLKNPELAEKYNIEAGGRILLYGPPGTGKTFIARAIAGEVDAEFFSVDCSDLISKYLGDSSKQIAELFKKAEESKRAIIFFDEIDAIASKRNDSGDGTDSEVSRFVSTFLTRIDGFKSKKGEMLLLFAATNRPWALDPAILRGGRFDTHIYVGTPDSKARLFMVEKAFKGIPVSPEVSFMDIAERLDGYGGGDVVAICKKIIQLAYKRAIELGSIMPVTEQDVDTVLIEQRNIITEDMLYSFEEFKNS